MDNLLTNSIGQQVSPLRMIVVGNRRDVHTIG